MRIASLVLLFLLASPKVWSACTTPNGVAGTLDYFTGTNDFQYCDGTNWVSLGSAATTSAIKSGFPDAIECDLSDPDYGPMVLYATFTDYTGNNNVYYRATHTTTYFQVGYTSAGAFVGYSNITTSDCNVPISTLISSGQAKFFGNDIAAVNSDDDGDTKIYTEQSTDEDKIRFDTAGSERMIIDSGGKVGIGITSPTYFVHTKSDSNSGQQIALENADAGATAFANFEVKNGNSTNEAMRIGVLGTGWSTSGGYVQDGAFISSGANLSGGMSIATLGAHDMRFYTNGITNQRMVIQADGDVGIGTTNPTAKLQVSNTYSGTTYSTQIGDGAYAFVETVGSTADDDDVAYYSMHRGGDTAWQIGIFGGNFTIANGGGAATENMFPTKPLTIQKTTGNVGIGVTTPDSPLHIANNVSTAGPGASLGNYQILLYDTGSAATSYGIGIESGHMWFNTNSGYKFYYANTYVGNINSLGAYTQISDERKKDDIHALDSSLEKISSLDGYSYVFKHDPKKNKQLGVIAQEVREVFPELVTEQEDGTLSVQYSGFIAPLIEAVKELVGEVKKNQQMFVTMQGQVEENSREIASLKAENNELKDRLGTVEEELEILKAQMNELLKQKEVTK